MPSPWRRFDRALKRIAEEEPVGLLDANLSKELVDTVREVDVVWRAAREGRPFLLHLEFQLIWGAFSSAIIAVEYTGGSEAMRSMALLPTLSRPASSYRRPRDERESP